MALSLNHQLVLEEEEYTQALSDIIARDFFPSLVHLDATNSYLDAVSNQDPEAIQASVRRLEAINTPAYVRSKMETPYGPGPSDTPLRTPRGDQRPTKRPKHEHLSLDSFQARFTSEDNSSFTQILDEENRQRKEKWSWAWAAQKRVEEQQDRMLESRERSLIEAAPINGVRGKLLVEPPKPPAGLLTAGDEGRDDDDEQAEPQSTQVIVRKESHDVDVLAPMRDTRPAGVTAWKFKARNSLMFPPDADESPYHQAPHVKRAAERGVQERIVHQATRLPQQEEHGTGSVSAPPSPTRSRIDAAIMGTPYNPRSPGREEYSLVPDIPSPTPAELGPAAMKQLMTWGTIMSTPRIIQSDDSAGTPFRISEPTAREQISHKLASKASKSLRAKAELLALSGQTPKRGLKSTAKGKMGPPPSTPRKSVGSLTPAAKRLLSRTAMGAAGTRRAEAMDRTAGWEGAVGGKEKDLWNVRWTPTPGRSIK